MRVDPEDVDRMRKGISAVNARDWGTLAELLDDGFTLRSVFSPGRVYRGRYAFRDLMADLDEALTDYTLTEESIEPVGGRLLVTVRLDATGRASDLHVTRRAWMVWEVRDGIAYSAVSYDTIDEAFAAAGDGEGRP